MILLIIGLTACCPRGYKDIFLERKTTFPELEMNYRLIEEVLEDPEVIFKYRWDSTRSISDGIFYNFTQVDIKKIGDHIDSNFSNCFEVAKDTVGPFCSYRCLEENNGITKRHTVFLSNNDKDLLFSFY